MAFPILKHQGCAENYEPAFAKLGIWEVSKGQKFVFATMIRYFGTSTILTS
jgi:hypothetical protein